MNGKGEGAGPMGAGGARPREATFTFTGTRVRLLCSVHPPPLSSFWGIPQDRALAPALQLPIACAT